MGNALRFSHKWSASGQAAINYLGSSWPVIPVVAGGKRPLVKWKVYQERIPTLDEWSRWDRSFAHPNMALVCGAVSGLYSVDCDGDQAVPFLAALGPLPSGPCVRTPRGVRWIVCRTVPPTRPLTVAGDGWSVTLLGERSLAILPPSIHPSGKTYSWCPDLSPKEVSPQEIPPKTLAALLNSVGRQEVQPGNLTYTPVHIPTHPLPFNSSSGEAIPEGARNVTLFREACQLAREGAPDHAVRAFLLVLNSRCVPPLGAEELNRIAQSATRY